jgi:RND family efflux transporter MFP subunit
MMSLKRERRDRHQYVTRALVILVLSLSGCERGSHPATPAAEVTPVRVHVARVERISLPGSQAVAGTVRPLERALIGARVMGSVADANFTIGQAVSVGEVLLTIQAGELKARLEQARAALNQAKRDVVRETTLLAQGSSTQEAVHSAEDRLQMTTAAFEEAQTLLSYARITAPFSGFVTQKLVNTGDFAAPGTQLLELEARDRMRAELDVPDTLPSLPFGAEVPVIGGGSAITGRISEASSAANPTTRTRRVIVDLPSGSPVHSGEFVRALWPTEKSGMLFAPADAVRPFGQIERVFVVDEGRAAMRFVKTGRRENDRVQILSGLTSGELVIVSPPAELRDGHPVQVQP